MTLDQLAIQHQTDKASTHHGYTKYYEHHFEPLRNDYINLVEIGYGGYDFPDRGGAGARMWLDYFPKANIISVDLHQKTNIPHNRRYLFIQRSQDDEQLKDDILYYGAPDIIIDDASHICDLTLKTFELLFPLLRSGGYYVIEDIEGSFFDGWSKGTQDYNDFYFPHPANLGRRLINDVNAGHIPNYQAGYSIESLHFYNNILFIKKK